MPDLTFEAGAIVATPHAATPQLALALRIRAGSPTEEVRAVALSCQVRIEAQRRRYTPAEQAALRALFGEPEGFARTVRPLLWAHAAVTVPAFVGEASVELPLPCTYDLAVASARYFHALDGGEAPLLLLFSGTVFYPRADGALQVAQVPWSKEARVGLPVSVWREAIDLYYPGSAPLLLRRDLFERLDRYRASRGLTSWEQALESLLPALDEAGAR